MPLTKAVRESPSTHFTCMLNSPARTAAQAVPTVTLFVPALFWPHGRIDHAAAPVVPALQRLLARGDRSVAHCENEDAWLCAEFGVERQMDWPCAPLALAGCDIDPGQDFWLCADPVHLQVNRDELILLTPASLSLSAAEAAALCATLNSHFVSAELTFSAPRVDRWFLKTRQPARIRTHGLASVAGRNVDPLLPSGPDQLAWHGIFNEVQMVLHAHPVNEQRQQRGELPINSVWFSGAGILPSARAAGHAVVVGSSALAKGLAKRAGIPFEPLKPARAALGERDLLVEFQAPAKAAMALDAVAWKRALEALEADWFSPVAQMLRKGQASELIIATVAFERSIRWRIARAHLWRIWRASAPLASAEP